MGQKLPRDMCDECSETLEDFRQELPDRLRVINMGPDLEKLIWEHINHFLRTESKRAILRKPFEKAELDTYFPVFCKAILVKDDEASCAAFWPNIFNDLQRLMHTYIPCFIECKCHEK